MKLKALITCLVLMTASPIAMSREDQGHAYARLREAVFDFKDFEYPSLTGERFKLSEAVNGKKLVLVHYFAAWCHNSNYDVVTINEIYHKYRDRGFTVIGVCEYSTRDELRKFIKKHRPAYPIYLEGETKKRDRTSTTHYAYRQKVGDERLWGTPFNILISADDVNKEGEIVTSRVRVATGELIKTEFEEAVREQLMRD